MSKRAVGGFVDFGGGGLDPAVAALVGAGEARQAEQRLPPAERQAKAKAKAKARARERVMLDLPAGITAWIKAEAEAQGCTASQVAACLLAVAINDGEIDLRQYREINRVSKRYEVRLRAPEILRQRDTPKKR